MITSDSSIQTVETLISISAQGDNFYAVISKLQGLHSYLQHNSSSRCEDDYLVLLEYVLENYLDERKKLFFRQRVGEIITASIKDPHAAKYFKQRFARMKLINLLKQHRKSTDKWFILDSIDYKAQKFKVKQVSKLINL